MIENFNDRYQQMFLGRIVMATEENLKTGSLVFERRHNSRYRSRGSARFITVLLILFSLGANIPVASRTRFAIQGPE